MKVFFDASVLVAGSEQSHPQYAQARPALQRVVGAKDRGFISVHSIAEVDAVLTRLPVHPRIHPAEAGQMVTDNIVPHFATVAIGKKDYIEALRLAGSGGWSGAKIYDALLLGCAARREVNWIYSFNLRDFRQLVSSLEAKICTVIAGRSFSGIRGRLLYRL